jgi:OOP family OmpA-OmpF porin
MIRLFVTSLCLLLLSTSVQAKDDHQVGLKLGLTSIDNEDGWNFENGSFFADFTYDTHTVVKPRFDFGYISLDEDENGGVGSLLQFALNGIYDIDLGEYSKTLTPYLLGGLGYEYVPDSTIAFESHPYVQAGFGLKYPLSDKFSLVTEFKALQMFDNDNSDEDNEFTILLGFNIPLFIDVITAPAEQLALPAVPQLAPVVSEPVYVNDVQSDLDNDGVVDSLDACPNTPADKIVDEQGCMVVNAVVIPENVTFVKESKPTQTKQPRAFTRVKRQHLSINFQSNSAWVKGESKGLIKRYARFLNDNPDIKVTIEGYTDSSGLRSKNIELSQRRAEAVVAILKSHGVKSWRLKAVGKGDLNPIATNDTVSGRAKNRRIEAVIKD